jgi:uncharacterized protein YcgL (UPF0745 family)
MDRVEQRLRRKNSILESAGIPFAIVGGNAIRIWVAQVDPGAVRTTNDEDVLIRAEDLERVKKVMSEHGYHHRKAAGLDRFLERQDDFVRYATHVVLANQMVKENDFESNPDVELSVYGDGILTLPLERLVRMKLNSFRLKDRVHILDLIDVGLLNESWIPRFPQPLGERLKSLIENPDQ